MFSLIGSNIIFNIIEYFSFINLFLLFLFIIITLFFILINSTLLYYSNVNCNHCLIEFISTLFSLLFLVIIISPALIILLDFDLVVLPSFTVYSLGLQWAWQFNIIFLPINTGYNAYCDHYIISTDHYLSTSYPQIEDLRLINDYMMTSRWIFNDYIIIDLPINTGFNAYCDHYIISTDHYLSTIYLLTGWWIDTGYNAYCDHYLVIDYYSTSYLSTIYSLCSNYSLVIYYLSTIYSLTGWWIDSDWLMDRGLMIIEWLIDRMIAFKIDRFILCSSLQYNQFKTNTDTAGIPLDDHSLSIDHSIIKFPFYLWDINNYILLPIYSFIRLFLYSFDVIHTLGFYSWGIKIDAIPGRINLATTLRLLWKGEYRGKCSESCGQGHLSMIMLSLIIY